MENQSNLAQTTQPQQIRDDDNDQNQVIKLYLKPNAPKIVRVIAAPGSGKTTTICRLLKKMFSGSSKPLYPNILVLTFTKRTRTDLVRKINELGLQSRKEQIINRIRNFHSLAKSLLFWNKIIQDSEEKEVFKEFSLNLKPSQNEESNPNKKDLEKQKIQKIALKTIHKFLAQALTEQQKQIQLQKLKTSKKYSPAYQLVSRYLDWLQLQFKEKKNVTFDYSIIKAIEYINAKKPCYKIPLDDLDLIIVDEFQDSNPAQVKLIDSLMKRSKKQIKLLMIGDYDQNIYTWRGAKISAIQKFIQSQKQWHPMFLRRTYRLSETVMNISQLLINSDPNYTQFRQKFYKKDYKLQAMNKRDHPVVVQQFYSQYSEVRWVVDKLYEHMEQGHQLKDITILCREFKNIKFYQKLKLELKRQEKIRGIQIPYDYQYLNSSKTRKEGLYLFALMRYFYKVQYLKNQRGDREDIIRILKIHNIGIQDEAFKRMISRQKIIKMYQKYCDLPKKLKQKQNSWNQFFIDFQRIKNQILAGQQIRQTLKNIYQILKHATWFHFDLLQSCVTDFIDAVVEYAESIDREEYEKEPIFSIVRKMVEEDEGTGRIESDDEKEQDAQNQDLSQTRKDEKNKKAKLSNSKKKGITMNKQLNLIPKKNKLTIQSIHNCKGLEYKIVFLCALNHAYFQSEYEQDPVDYQNLSDAERERKQNFQKDSMVEKMSEELRLIYTAVTRTSGYLYVSASKKDSIRYSFNPFLPPHPVFERLKKICECEQTIMFDDEKDGPSKEFILNKIAERQAKDKEKKLKKEQKKQAANKK